MPYLYHRVPPNMAGMMLYPLNTLKGVCPEAFRVHAQKYAGREKLMRERIPYLECLWNDVLFMSAVPPQDFCAAYYGVGFPRRRPMRFFRIDPGALEGGNLAVLTRMGINKPKEYLPYRPADLPSYARIPQDTYAYWGEEKARGNDRPFLWMHVPHILYKGSIDASGLEIIEL